MVSEKRYHFPLRLSPPHVAPQFIEELCKEPAQTFRAFDLKFEPKIPECERAAVGSVFSCCNSSTTSYATKPLPLATEAQTYPDSRLPKSEESEQRTLS